MRKRLGILALLLLTATVLCACRDGRTEGEGEGQPEDSISFGNDTGDGADDAVTGAPVYGGSVVVGVTQDFDSLDPHKVSSAGTREVLFNLFEGLVKPDENGELVGAIAQSYVISEDSTEYTFFLRESVKFHNGKTVTAEDVVYSLKRCAGLLDERDPEVYVETAFSIITNIEAFTAEDGGSGVTITLSEPNTELLSYLTCAIIPADYSEQASAPVGTGPFRFVSYSLMNKLVMEKNPDYYLEGVPYLDEVTFRISANTDAAFLELLSGGIDIFPYLTAEQAAQLGEAYRIEVGGMNLVQALFLNHAVAPFDDIRVRQALCYAIDRQLIIDMVGDGRGTVVGSGLFPSYKKYYNASLADYYSYDPARAKELLAAAGYPDGFSFSITVPSNYQYHVDTAQVIVEQLKAVGIKAEIQLVEWASWHSDVYQGRQYEATIIGLDANLSPSNILRFYPSTASRNFMNFSNEEFDGLYTEAIRAAGEEKEQAYRRLQEILAETAAAVYIQNPALIVAVNKQLAGYAFYPVFVQDMASVYYIAQ